MSLYGYRCFHTSTWPSEAGIAAQGPEGFKRCTRTPADGFGNHRAPPPVPMTGGQHAMAELARPDQGAAAPHAQIAEPAPRRLPQEAHDGYHEARQTSDEEAGADQALIEDEYLRAELESHFATTTAWKPCPRRQT